MTAVDGKPSDLAEGLPETPFGQWLRTLLPGDEGESVRALSVKMHELQPTMSARSYRREINRHIKGERPVSPEKRALYALALEVDEDVIPANEPPVVRRLRVLLAQLTATVENHQGLIDQLERRVRDLEIDARARETEEAPGKHERTAPPKSP